jgi:hypothetical protein
MSGTPILVRIIYVCGSVCVYQWAMHNFLKLKKKNTLRCVFEVGIK